MVSLIYSVIGRDKDSGIMPNTEATREGAREACDRSPPYGRRKAKRSGSNVAGHYQALYIAREVAQGFF